MLSLQCNPVQTSRRVRGSLLHSGPRLQKCTGDLYNLNNLSVNLYRDGCILYMYILVIWFSETSTEKQKRSGHRGLHSTAQTLASCHFQWTQLNQSVSIIENSRDGQFKLHDDTFQLLICHIVILSYCCTFAEIFTFHACDSCYFCTGNHTFTFYFLEILIFVISKIVLLSCKHPIVPVFCPLPKTYHSLVKPNGGSR